jgi:hypothetical protein
MPGISADFLVDGYLVWAATAVMGAASLAFLTWRKVNLARFGSAFALPQAKVYGSLGAAHRSPGREHDETERQSSARPTWSSTIRRRSLAKSAMLGSALAIHPLHVMRGALIIALILSQVAWRRLRHLRRAICCSEPSYGR